MKTNIKQTSFGFLFLGVPRDCEYIFLFSSPLLEISFLNIFFSIFFKVEFPMASTMEEQGPNFLLHLYGEFQWEKAEET